LNLKLNEREGKKGEGKSLFSILGEEDKISTGHRGYSRPASGRKGGVEDPSLPTEMKGKRGAARRSTLPERVRSAKGREREGTDPYFQIPNPERERRGKGDRHTDSEGTNVMSVGSVEPEKGGACVPRS